MMTPSIKIVSYMLLHWNSDSKVKVEFFLGNGQATLKSIVFLQGNVLELNAFREVRRLVRIKAVA